MLHTTVATSICMTGIAGAAIAALLIDLFLCQQLPLNEIFGFLIEAVVMTIALPAFLCLTQQHFWSLLWSSAFKTCCAEEDKEGELCCDRLTESGTDCSAGCLEVGENTCQSLLVDNVFDRPLAEPKSAQVECNFEAGNVHQANTQTYEVEGDVASTCDTTASEEKCHEMDAQVQQVESNDEEDISDMDDFEEDPQAVADFETWFQSHRVPSKQQVESNDDEDVSDLDDFEEDPQAVADFETWFQSHGAPSNRSELNLDAKSDQAENNVTEEPEVCDFQVDPLAVSMMHVGPSHFLLQVFQEAATSNGVQVNYNQIEDYKLAARAQEKESIGDHNSDDQEDNYENLFLEHFEEDPQALADYEAWRQSLHAPSN